MRKEPISVCMFSSATARAGAEEHILQLLHGLDRKQFRLHLACAPELAELIHPDVPSDVKIAVMSLDRVTDLKGAYSLWRFLRQNRVQILHSHMFRASMFASPVGRIARVPVVLETSHGREVWRKGWKASFFVDRFIARRVDGIIAVSEATSRYLVEQKRIPQEKITVICSAVDIRHFDPGHRAPEGLQHSLGFRNDDRVLVVAGRLEEQKGHRYLIEALPLVLREFPCARLVCLSDGSLRTQLQTMVRELGLQEAVRFVGYQPDVRDWLAIADISILPSLYEGLPLAAIEALASECPMVATAVDGTPEVILHGKTGLVVPARDPQRLAEAICEMLRDPERARKMAQTGRQLVLNKFSVEHLVQCTQEFYLQAWDRFVGRTLGRTATPERCQAAAGLRNY